MNEKSAPTLDLRERGKARESSLMLPSVPEPPSPVQSIDRGGRIRT